MHFKGEKCTIFVRLVLQTDFITGTCLQRDQNSYFLQGVTLACNVGFVNTLLYTDPLGHRSRIKAQGIKELVVISFLCEVVCHPLNACSVADCFWAVIWTLGDSLACSNPLIAPLFFSFQNLPFDINNRYKLTLYFIVYFTTGFSAPFIIVRHQLLKPWGDGSGVVPL